MSVFFFLPHMEHLVAYELKISGEKKKKKQKYNTFNIND